MERQLILYFILLLLTWTEAVDVNITVTLQPANNTNNQQPQKMGPANSLQTSKTTIDKPVRQIAAALSEKGPPPKEIPAHIAEHSRTPQDARPSESSDKRVQIAGPADPPPKPSTTEHPSKLKASGNSAHDFKTINDKSVRQIAAALSEKGPPPIEKPAHIAEHARTPQNPRPDDSSDKRVEIAGPPDPPPKPRTTVHPSHLVTPPAKSIQDSKTTNDKAVQEKAPSMSASKERTTKEKPLHPVDHARQPQDNRPLYSADKRVQVAAPDGPHDSAAHNATEKPKDVMTPGKSAMEPIATLVVLKREQSISNGSNTPNSTATLAKRDIPPGEEIPSDINSESLEAPKRDVQNIANILISTTKHVHNNNKKDQKPKQENTIEDPKCPTLAEFINGTQNLWNGIKTSDGVQGGLFTLFSAMSESVVVLAQCGLRLLTELGAFLNFPKTKNDKPEAKIDANSDPGNKVIGIIAVTEDPLKGNGEPLITHDDHVVENVDVEPREKNLVNSAVDFSVISTNSNIIQDGSLPLNVFEGTTPSNTMIVETNVSQTEVMESNPFNQINGDTNHAHTVVETNVTKTDLVDLRPTNPVVMESNFSATQVVDSGSSKPTNVESNIPNIVIMDTNQPRPVNVETNVPNNVQQPVNMVVVDSSLMNPVTENVPTKSPNVFTVNVYTINKEQGEKFYPSVLTHVDKVKADNAQDLSDYDYGDYSIENVNGPEDLKKKKRDGKGHRRARKRTVKSVNKNEKKP